MNTIRRLILAATLAIGALPAGAAFHLWVFNEIYSNADGTVQFVELRALAGGQQFVQGHTLVASQGGTGQSFVLPSNLPSDTNGHSLLIATQGFAALGIVSPDYIVPNFFFPLGNGTLNWGEGSDVWNYASMPADGTNSVRRDGSTGPNSPTNFAGQTGTVVLPTGGGRNYQSLWWKAPQGSESGWGVNITHQGDTLFATWFTYDTDGSPMWLVMSSAPKIAENVYGGQIYRTTGPAFSSATWDSTQVVVTQVGTGTFNFSDADNGTFSYTVNGVNQSKTITRQLFSSPVPACSAGGTPGATPNYQDLWWRSPAGSENGWGVNVTHQGDILFATWFTYGADGKGLWLVGSNIARTAPGTYSGPLYRTTGPAFNASPWNSNQVVVTQVGTATFTFSDLNNGTFAYSVNGVSQSKPITRQVFATPATVCR